MKNFRKERVTPVNSDNILEELEAERRGTSSTSASGKQNVPW